MMQKNTASEKCIFLKERNEYRASAISSFIINSLFEALLVLHIDPSAPLVMFVSAIMLLFVTADEASSS